MQTARIARSGAIGVLALIAATSAACKKAEPAAPTPPRPEYLAGVPAPAAVRLTDTTGSADAERRTYLTLISIDTLRAFYRDTLPKLGWSVRREQGDSTAFDLYTRKDPRTLWVHAEREALGGGLFRTSLTLIGSGGEAGAAVIDTRTAVPDSGH